MAVAIGLWTHSRQNVTTAARRVLLRKRAFTTSRINDLVVFASSLPAHVAELYR